MQGHREFVPTVDDVIIGHDVAIVADDDSGAVAHDGFATTAPTRIASEEEFKGIDHLLLPHLLGLLHLDVNNRLDRTLGSGRQVGGVA